MKIGIDLGGSHIAIGLVDENGKIIEKVEKNIKLNDNLISEIEPFIIENIMQFKLLKPIEMIGIAIPGTVSNNKIVKAVNLGINDYNLASRLKEILNIDVKLKNDAKCAALAEQKYGELNQYQDSIFLSIGTGVGGAVIFNGKLLEARNVPGFEFSHIVIQKNGTLCNCGKRGCFETYASMKRLKEKISKEFNLNTIEGEKIKNFILQNENNPTLKYIINNYIQDLAIGISNIINIFEPEVIGIGGSFVYFSDILLDKLKENLLQKEYLFNQRKKINIVQAILGNDAGIIGSTML